MVDLTDISIHKQYDRFLALLRATAGDNNRRRQISTEDCASYTYPQALIATNTNLPFFVASPKLFALMNDTTAPVTRRDIGGKTVTVRTIEINGKQIELTKLSEIAEVKQGLATGDNDSYLFQNPEARGNYRDINKHRQFLLTEADLKKIQSNDDLRKAVIENGISKDNKKSPCYFDGRYIVPYDKGGESDSDEGWMPNYFVPTNYFIDWSEWAVKRMEALTIFQRNKEQGKSGGAKEQRAAVIRNPDTYFANGISFSRTGVYSPTFRLGSTSPYDTEGSMVFSLTRQNINALIALLSSHLQKFILKSYVGHTVHCQIEEVKDAIVLLDLKNEVCRKVSAIIKEQHANPRYDYASHEQLEIDRLIYEAYGLDAEDIAEVETWYARRYPKLAAAQRENLKRVGKLPSFTEWNIYCDESRHLAHDHAPKMFLGALSVPRERVRPLTEKLRATLRALGFPQSKPVSGSDGRMGQPPLHAPTLAELKWTKVSPAGLKFYEAALDFFATEPDLRFHVLAADKAKPSIAKLPKPPPVPDDGDYDCPAWCDYNAYLENAASAAVDYLQEHEMWYYDRYFDLLRRTIKPALGKHVIYLDVKDTKGGPRIRALGERLSDAHYDWLRDNGKQTVEAVRQIQSHEVLLDQLTDILLGAFSWTLVEPPHNPGGKPSLAKTALVAKLHTLMESSPEKFEIISIPAQDKEAAE